MAFRYLECREFYGVGFPTDMFKKFICVLSIGASLSCVSTAYSASLSDSVSQALTTHPLVTAGKASREQARKNVKEQRSDFYPVISATGRTGRVRQNDDTTRANTGGDAYSWLGEGSFAVTQPIFSGFSTVKRTDAAIERMGAADNELQSTSEDITLKAARAHLNLMRTKELLEIAKNYLSAIEERHASIALMVKEGASDEAEQLQAEEILMSAKTTKLGYDEAYRQAEADYIQVVGSPPGDMLEFGQATWDAFVPKTIEEAIAQATTFNPKILAANGMVSAIGDDAEAARGALMPKVDAEMSYLKKDQDDNLGGELSSAQAMLKMSWGFSTGGAELARIDKGLEQQKEARAKRDDAFRSIEHDVRQKFTSMNIVDEQFGLYTDRETASEKILSNYLSQFEGGKQTNLQLISANAKLFEAKAGRTDAFYRRLLSRFELLNAMGKLRAALTAAAPETISRRN